MNNDKSSGIKKFSTVAQELSGKPTNTKEVDNNNEVNNSQIEAPKKRNPKKTSNTDQNKTNNVDMKENFDINDVNGLDISFTGKIVHFPSTINVEAHKALTMLERIKISKNSLWYMLIEKQNNELQMIKYNSSVGVDLNQFVNDLKLVYINQFKENKVDNNIIKLIESIEVTGKDKYSIIKNIPKIKINGTSLISKISKDLIHLLKD